MLFEELQTLLESFKQLLPTGDLVQLTQFISPNSHLNVVLQTNQKQFLDVVLFSKLQFDPKQKRNNVVFLTNLVTNQIEKVFQSFLLTVPIKR
jgi:microcystin degradation protein MlrC